MRAVRFSVVVATTLAAATAPSVRALGPGEIRRGYEIAARQADPGFAGLSAERGARLFRAAPAGDWSCATCHGDDPTGPGRHARTGRAISPLSPTANAQRFADPAKVEKWFKRNCQDVLGRVCTAQEKGDVLAWLLSLK